jgi:hypothetical protein
MWKFDDPKDSVLVRQEGTWAVLAPRIDWKVRFVFTFVLSGLCDVDRLLILIFFRSAIAQDDCYGDVRLRKKP